MNFVIALGGLPYRNPPRDRSTRLAPSARVLTHAVALVITLFLPQAQSERPKAAEHVTAKADVDRVQGRFDDAIRLLVDEEVMYPRHNLLLGRAYEREQNLAKARAAYTRVIESTSVVSIELGRARPIAQERVAAIGR